MSPTILIALLVAGLLALIPLRRLRAADWPDGWLQTIWLVLFGLVTLVLVVPSTARFLAPLLLILFVLPFVLGTDRLRRLARRPVRRPSGVVIDVTPRPIDEPASDVSARGQPPPA